MEESTHNVVSLDPSQYEIWDKFVDESPQGDNFCYSWWLDTITKSNFKVLAIFDQEKIVAGIPLAYDKNGKVTEPPLTRTLGPIFKNQNHLSPHKQASNQRNWLLALLQHFSPEDVVAFCTHQNFTDWLPFKWKGFQQTTRYTYIISYKNKNEEDLWADLNRGRKGIINKAYKNNITISSTDDFKLFYHLVELTYKRQGIKFRFPYDAFHKLDKEINKRNKRRIFIASDQDGQIHAALYVTFNKKTAYNILSGGDPTYRHLGSHTLIIWEAIKYFQDKTQEFNFGGSDIERIEKHMKGFGGNLTPYFQIYTDHFRKRKIQINQMPHFSIITPTNKRPDLLKRCIESVQNQSFKNYEHIIIDDANDNETTKVIKSIQDKRIKYFKHQQPSGAAAAYNTGIKMSHGEFICFLDDDDEYLPGILEKTNQIFKDTGNSLGFIWTGVIRVKDSEEGEMVLLKKTWPKIFETKEEGLTVATGIGNGFGVCVRKNCIDEIGLFDESLIVSSDTDFMIRLAEKYEFQTIPEILVKIHHHGPSQLTNEKNTLLRWQSYTIIMERHAHFLSKHWKLIHSHSKAYASHSYFLKKRKAGRKILLNLIKTYPNKWIHYADLVSFEIVGMDYKKWNRIRKTKKKTERISQN